MDKIMTELRDLYNSHGVLKTMIKKQLIGRYKNSLLGFGWNFMIPLMMIFTYYIVFSQIRSVAIPSFWIYISSAIFPFSYMVSSITNGSGCIVNNADMIKKIYFPRELLIISEIVSSTIILSIGCIIVTIAIALSGYNLQIAIAFAPLLIIMMAIFSMGCMLIFSSLVVYVRDVQYFLNSFSIIFFFMTPMYFTTDSVSGALSAIIWSNPLTYFIDGFHQLFYYGALPDTQCLLIMLSLDLVTILLGIIIFNRLKKGFVERL